MTGKDAEMSKMDDAPETPMADEVGSKIRELTREFHIASIRSVVFIDDEFPTLETLLKGKNDTVADAEVKDVAGMTDPDAPQFTTSTTSATDTESGAGYTATPAEDNRVLQLVESCHRKGLLVDILNDYPAGKDFWKRADLLVLDYRIHDSEQKTIDALRELSREKGFKPVIIYTHDGAEGVAEHIHSELTGRKKDGDKDNMPTGEGNDDCPKQNSLNDVPCFRYNNLFIVVVKKNNEGVSRAEEGVLRGATIDTLLEKLERGLLKDPPSPMNILAWIIAVDLRRHIHENIDKMLPTNEDKASALFAAIHNAGDTRSREGGLLALDKILGVLFRKATSSLSDDTQTALTGLLACIGRECGGKIFDFVHGLEKAFANKGDDPYAHLNKFICNEPDMPDKVTTGTIFSTEDSSNYYVCVSPECDLARVKWKKLCCVELTTCGKVSKKLKELNSNKYILFTDGGSVKMAAVDPLKITLHDFFLREGDSPKYYKVLPPRSEEQPECRVVNINIVAQLRPEYAHRLMARVGAWHSRIGLDFIKKPSA